MNLLPVARNNDSSGIAIYASQPSFKWVVLAISVVISLGSVIYTNNLVKKIRKREKKQINLYARALEYLANESDAVNFMLVLDEIIQANTTIPVISSDQNGNPEYYKNLPKADKITDKKQRREYLTDEIERMKSEREPIRVTMKDGEEIYGYKYIYYRNSLLLTQLKIYPYVQLSIIAIFGLITFAVFNYSRAAEQNRVWVGMAKETAHQLGTPLSSLMAWQEYLKSMYPEDPQIAEELGKDVDRLSIITERFSNIGSTPQLKAEKVYDQVSKVVNYLQRRISSKVEMEVGVFPNEEITASLNPPLFAWVVENLIKNAVDAMEGKGRITIKILRVNNGQVAVDVTDTGKGISKSNVGKVFKPGFTTKKRGWGLGLALTRRIVEIYHGGRIFVKWTEVNKGTTFRVLLKL